MKKQFNDPLQEKAINHGIGPAIVLAGPGSGKTFIITNRIQNLIEKYGVQPSSILVITFTKAAAKEMKQRFLSVSNDSTQKPIFGTFHSIFYQFLKFFNPNLSLKIIDYETKTRIINQILTNNSYKELESEIYKDSYDDLISAISFYKTNKSNFPAHYSKNVFLDFFKQYEELKEAAGYIDYDDILIETYNMLSSNEEYRNFLSKKYEYILIDEFQDINLIQYNTIKLLVNDKNNIFVVGDDDQSIYGFRGAFGRIFQEFINDFPGTVKIELETNYRSSKKIVESSSIIIKDNVFRIKSKDSIPFKDEIGLFYVKDFDDPKDQFSFIEKIILKAKSDKKSIGILTRTNKDVEEIKNYLQRNQSNRYGKNIIEYEIIKDISSYLSFCLNNDRKSVLRICRVPERFIPKDIFIDSKVNLNRLAKQYAGTAKGNQLNILNRQINLMRNLGPFAFLTYLFNIIGYRDYINSTYPKDKAKNINTYLDNLLLKSKNILTLNDLHSNISSDSPKDKDDDISYVMTFHASKGLEFDIVIIPNVNEGHVPGREAILTSGDIDEERRLFYVAMTRAKEELYISYLTHNGNISLLPSRFITKFLK